ISGAVVVAAAADEVPRRAVGEARVLPHVADHVREPERAVGEGMAAHLVWAVAARCLAVCDVHVRVVRAQIVSVRKPTIVGTTGGALPFAVGAQPRTR